MKSLAPVLPTALPAPSSSRSARSSLVTGAFGPPAGQGAGSSRTDAAQTSDESAAQLASRESDRPAAFAEVLRSTRARTDAAREARRSLQLHVDAEKQQSTASEGDPSAAAALVGVWLGRLAPKSEAPSDAPSARSAVVVGRVTAKVAQRAEAGQELPSGAGPRLGGSEGPGVREFAGQLGAGSEGPRVDPRGANAASVAGSTPAAGSLGGAASAEAAASLALSLRAVAAAASRAQTTDAPARHASTPLAARELALGASLPPKLDGTALGATHANEARAALAAVQRSGGASPDDSPENAEGRTWVPDAFLKASELGGHADAAPSKLDGRELATRLEAGHVDGRQAARQIAEDRAARGDAEPTRAPHADKAEALEALGGRALATVASGDGPTARGADGAPPSLAGNAPFATGLPGLESQSTRLDRGQLEQLAPGTPSPAAREAAAELRLRTTPFGGRAEVEFATAAGGRLSVRVNVVDNRAEVAVRVLAGERPPDLQRAVADLVRGLEAAGLESTTVDILGGSSHFGPGRDAQAGPVVPEAGGVSASPAATELSERPTGEGSPATGPGSLHVIA